MASASRSRSVSSFLLLAAFASSAACSVILNPRDDVARCSNVSDCEEPEDTRFEAVCIADESANIDTTQVEQVCVAQFTTIGCDPMSYDVDNPFRAAVDSRNFSDYACTDTPGVQGCPPEAGVGCQAGLEVNVLGTCDVPGAEIPAINHNAWDVEAQDVKDQFCRGYFCDDTYVCNTEFNRCQPCDPTLEFGKGGCGVVYTQGTESCVYVSPDEVCDAPNSSTNEPIFGDCVLQ